MINVLIFVLLFNIATASEDVLLYVYPIDANMTIPKGCSMNKTQGIFTVCICKSDMYCGWEFNDYDIYGYITFNRPRFLAAERYRYNYYVNTGVNDFKLNSHCSIQSCDRLTVSYLYEPDSPILIQIIRNFEYYLKL